MGWPDLKNRKTAPALTAAICLPDLPDLPDWPGLPDWLDWLDRMTRRKNQVVRRPEARNRMSADSLLSRLVEPLPVQQEKKPTAEHHPELNRLNQSAPASAYRIQTVWTLCCLARKDALICAPWMQIGQSIVRCTCGNGREPLRNLQLGASTRRSNIQFQPANLEGRYCRKASVYMTRRPGACTRVPADRPCCRRRTRRREHKRQQPGKSSCCLQCALCRALPACTACVRW